MAVTLPPPLPPEQAPLAEIQQQIPRAQLRAGRYRVHLVGEIGLDIERIAQALGVADSAETVARAVGDAYRQAGRLGAQVHYAADGDDLYISVSEKPLLGVAAPRELAPFFRGADELSASELEPRRMLASAYAERARIGAQTSLQPASDGYLLDIEAQALDQRPARFSAEFANPGNRFAGRYFAELEGSYADRHGDLLTGSWRSALTHLNDDEFGADDYNEGTLSASSVTPIGIFGLTVRALDYSRDKGLRVDGDVDEAEFAWLYPLAATQRSGLIGELRYQYSDYRERRGQELETSLHERYPSVQAGLLYRRDGVAPQDWDFSLGLTARKGLRSEPVAGAGDLDFLLWRPTASLNRDLGDSLGLGFSVSSQYSAYRLPAQAQWVLGGLDNLSAYLPGVAIGDSGLLALADLQIDAPDLFGLRVLPRVFAEYGLAHLQQALAGEPSTVELADIGAELGLRWRPHLRATLSAALPVYDRGIDERRREDSEAKLLFSVKALF